MKAFLRWPKARNTLLLIALVGCYAPTARAQTAREWVLQARNAYQGGQFEKSADCYARAIEAGAKSSTTFFDAACAAARANRVDAAFERLDGAVKHGFLDDELLSSDPDLLGLYEDPRWSELVARCRHAIASLQEPGLRRELLDMRRNDQAIRRGESLPELADMGMGDIDAVHTARMKEIVAAHGWPTRSLVGGDGARSAWLLVQHADADPAFQRQCLDLMNELAAEQVSAVDVAYLTDRVLVNEGKHQIYGTQFWIVDGQLVPRPIEDEAGVEARRTQIGMVSMQDYHKRMTGRNWVPKSAP